MDTTLIQSYFAPAERAQAAEIAAQHRRLRAIPSIEQLLDCFPEPAMILNPQRQVVQANNALAELVKVEANELLGLRPGEILNCIHAHECAGGCGTSKFCRQCGAIRAVWGALRTQTGHCEECRITCANGKGHVSLDLRVWATPLDFDKSFMVFAVRDITDEKRRAILERLFFHDVLNAAGGLKGIIEILPDLSQGEAAEMGRMASALAEELLEEIRSHRDLVAAERGDLVPEWTEVDAGEMLTQLRLLYGHHPVAAADSTSDVGGTRPGRAVAAHDGRLLLGRPRIRHDPAEEEPMSSALGIGYVPSCSSGFSVAITRNGRGRG